jgi:hypothetical protein
VKLNETNKSISSYVGNGDFMKSVLVLILAFSSFASADVLECTAGSEKRELEVASVEKGCELKYTKAGNVEIKATQKNGEEKCVEVRGRIQKNLEGAGYTCATAKN